MGKKTILQKYFLILFLLKARGQEDTRRQEMALLPLRMVVAEGVHDTCPQVQ